MASLLSRATAAFAGWFSTSIPSTGAHEGASRTDRAIASWNPSETSADADLLGDLSTLRARAIDLIRNNGVAAGARRTIQDNIMGTGFQWSSKPDYEILGRDREWARDWSRRAQVIARQALNDRRIDIRELCRFNGLTRQALGSVLESGEAVAVVHFDRRRPGSFGIRLQLIDPARLVTPLSVPRGVDIRDGIERDKYGRPVAYHIANRHPGEALGWNTPWKAPEVVRVPARTSWGRPRVLHVFEVDRVEVSRGKSLFAAILKNFKVLDKYSDAELKAAVVNALVAMVVETPMDSAQTAQMFNSEFDAMVEAGSNYYRGTQMKPGMILKLAPGDEAKSFNPGRPATSFDPFVTAFLRQIGVALGLPLELLVKDFSKTNYSSARAALLEAWKFFQGMREWFCEAWCQPVIEMVIEEAVDLGLIEADDFYENKAAYCEGYFFGSPKGYIDPIKEAEASAMRVANNTSTLERECAEQGLDWEDVAEQRAYENERLRELGLTAPDVLQAPGGTARPVEDEEQRQSREEGGAE